jgi:O-antigen/teichoic acid export membrane protein
LIVLVVSLGALFNMASGSNTSIIFNSEHHKKGIYILGGVFVFLVGLLFLLVPQYGTLGAAIAVSTGTFAYNFGKFAFIKKHYKMQPFSIDSLKLAILIGAVAAMGIYLPHLENAFVDILYRGSIVSLAYLSISYFWKLIPEELLKPARKYMPFINW